MTMAKRAGTGDADPLLGDVLLERRSDITPHIATQVSRGRNGALPARVHLCVISAAGTSDRFDAMVGGDVVVRSSRTPFLDAARVLLNRGIDPNSRLILRHAGSAIDSLRAKVGVAAKLTVKESRTGGVPTSHATYPFLPLRWRRPSQETKVRSPDSHRRGSDLQGPRDAGVA